MNNNEVLFQMFSEMGMCEGWDYIRAERERQKAAGQESERDDFPIVVGMASRYLEAVHDRDVNLDMANLVRAGALISIALDLLVEDNG